MHPKHKPKNLSFGIYHPLEIKKLSVVEITNLDPFDDLENPVPNGLHDLRLGSVDGNTCCQTCSLSGNFCPGHFGHLLLPLPVFNPVLLKTLYKLLKGICINCHRVQINDFDAALLQYQIQALDRGLVSVVQELTKIARKRVKFEDYEIGLQSILNEAIKGSNFEEGRIQSRVKSVIEFRQQIIQDSLKTLNANSKKKCIHCHEDLLDSLKSVNDIFAKRNFLHSQKKSASFDPLEVKNHLTLVWKNDSAILKHLFPCLGTAENLNNCPMDIFFIEVLLIPPKRFRLSKMVENQKWLNPQTLALSHILDDACMLRHLLDHLDGRNVPHDIKAQFYKLPGSSDKEKFNNLWHQLQLHVNALYDDEPNKFNDADGKFAGVRQMIEKKEGLLREQMMGKRVNFAARSVISPNPYLSVEEIGVPLSLAKKLTYPEVVTDRNVNNLIRKAVKNGPDNYPGANKVETKGGMTINLNTSLDFQDYARQWLRKKRLNSSHKNRPVKVHRHLKNGDIVLLNRQPTLHRPSIMAHKVRVLPGSAKTLQFHYANCKAYNADFDGDEMNLHFPQCELGRAEALCLLNISKQYLVPRDGTPLTGLIQDHIVAGVLLTMRDRFFSREEYQQLVYDAVVFLKKPVKTLPPFMLKPVTLWSGKQVISTIILNVITEGIPLLTMDGKARISSKIWPNASSREWTGRGTPLLDGDMSESQVIIRSGELLCGVLDKAHIGPTPYGLIHCCYELYGGETSTQLLTSLTRLFMNFLQTHSGFTLSIDDVCLTQQANKKRRKAINTSHANLDKVVAEASAVEYSKVESKKEIRRKFEEAKISKNYSLLETLNFEMKRAADDLNNTKNHICMTDGLLKKFPKNNFQLMVHSGSKGSLINAVQICSGLGQIDLEGSIFPRMLNGNTLPAYAPYDTSLEAGGFANGRFLSGLNPKEFFFHCRAGREGLVDTAVKTSSSGYLQRCLIKHLEGLMINYDLTVRDADGSVIQFLYGEDGLDVAKVQMLKKDKLDILANNYAVIENKTEIEILKAKLPGITLPPNWLKTTGEEPSNQKDQTQAREPEVSDHSSEMMDKRIMTAVLAQNLCDVYFELKNRPLKKFGKKNFDPVNSVLRPDLTFGCVSERLNSMIEDYVKTRYIKHILNRSGDSKEKRYRDAIDFLAMVYHRALKATASPGEAVGVLAAQSIGEPSTQMTLNTFHFAGQNEMNVTLGIPRLKEILFASSSIHSSTMNLPLLNVPNVEDNAKKLCLKFSRVFLSQVLQSIEIEESVHVKSKSHRLRKYGVKMTFSPASDYENLLYTSPPAILKYIENCFIEKIIETVKNSFSKKPKRRSPKKSAPFFAEMDNEGEVSYNDEDNEIMDSGSGPDYEEDLDDTAGACFETRINGKQTMNSSKSDKFSFEHDEILDAVERRKSREKGIVSKFDWISKYECDTKHGQWCKFELQIPLELGKCDLKTIIENEANEAILHHVPNIKSAILVEDSESKGNGKMIKVDGVNFREIFNMNLDSIIDTRKIYSNNIQAVAEIYGIEAAIRVIVKEIKNVFVTYGITVDPRHLLLIADYMTASGTIKAFNRFGIPSNPSILQKMTFETAANFLENAIAAGETDELESPSARIIIGQPVALGTGSFDVLHRPSRKARVTGRK